ncbi:hypothetical protein HPB47_008543 [Ixodes persulcatus]|uniref:Uncharacterized protein n=1 Tax=Ixodes persulcatus TaxID=34615 RepID=A0AC60QZ45_IXOPE|nr:hypothetical protein HPB47_008543 [Ixodes persulcatus]
MAEFCTLEDLTPLEIDILRRTADLGMISYDATPTCDVDDSSASESCSGSEDEPAAMSEDEDGAFDETGRIGNTDWCQCGCCAQMPTADECVCCREYPAAASRQPGCLTSNPDFETVCLNPGVLEVAYLMMRHYRQDGMGTTAHERNRYAAYRQCVLWLWRRLGQHNRRPLPSCVVKAIRGRFPDTSYSGFRHSN